MGGNSRDWFDFTQLGMEYLERCLRLEFGGWMDDRIIRMECKTYGF